MFDPNNPKFTDLLDSSNNASPEALIKAAEVDKEFLIESIVPLVYEGTQAGSPFNAYNAKILYYGVYVKTVGNIALTVSVPRIIFYDKNNAVFITDSNIIPYYDTVQAQVEIAGNPIINKNIVFFRYLDTIYTDLIFIGYVATLK